MILKNHSHSQVQMSSIQHSTRHVENALLRHRKTGSSGLLLPPPSQGILGAAKEMGLGTIVVEQLESIDEV